MDIKSFIFIEMRKKIDHNSSNYFLCNATTLVFSQIIETYRNIFINKINGRFEQKKNLKKFIVFML